LLLAAIFSAPALPAETDSPPPLRLCADPDNLPFTSSNPAAPGVYLELAQYLAGRLNRPLQPVWTSTNMVKRMLRETLLTKKCDLFIGLPNDPDFMGPKLILSRPVLDVGFALVAPRASTIVSAADLSGKRVAAQFATPPHHWLEGRSDIVTLTALTPEEGMRILEEGRADAAVLWGPSAGYLNKIGLRDAYRVAPVRGDLLQGQVTIAFARSESALRDDVDKALAADPAIIAGLKQRYGFPDQPPIDLGDAAAPLVKVAAGDSAAASPGADASKDARPSTGAAPAPAAAPAAASAGSVEAGHTLFNVNCSHCHGPNAIQGERHIDLRLLHHRYGEGMDEMFHTTVTHGRTDKGMPNWSGILSEQEFADILAWLHSVQQDK
jgi:polar amino acid transport system substrate-binding protein